MRSEDKAKLNPVSEPKAPPKSEAEKHAREQLKRERERTQKFKRDYLTTMMTSKWAGVRIGDRFCALKTDRQTKNFDNLS